MSDLMAYAAALEGLGDAGTPPVDKWNPDYCGELDLTIRSDGVWMYQGSPIGRARLVRLFASVLKKEGDRYYLVTPVEKLGIRVEDAPFLAVLMQVENPGPDQRLVFTTNVGEAVAAGPDHALDYRRTADGRSAAPYLHVRRGLEAQIARAVYYDLAAIGETREVDGRALFGVASGGVFFPFGPADEIFT